METGTFTDYNIFFIIPEHWMIMAIHEYHNKYSHRKRFEKSSWTHSRCAIHFGNFVLLNAERI